LYRLDLERSLRLLAAVDPHERRRVVDRFEADRDGAAAPPAARGEALAMAEPSESSGKRLASQAARSPARVGTRLMLRADLMVSDQATGHPTFCAPVGCGASLAGSAH
jgi:hypothetical protein